MSTATQSSKRMEATIAHQNNWQVGDHIASDGDVVEITAIGEEMVLGKYLRVKGHDIQLGEANLCLTLREWIKVRGK